MLLTKALITIVVTHIGYFKYCHLVSALKSKPGVKKCILNIPSDLPKARDPQPLYLKPNTSEYWMPNYSGQLIIPKNSLIELYCKSTFLIKQKSLEFPILSYNSTTIFLRCLKEKLFTWKNGKVNQTYTLNSFLCKRWTLYKIDYLNEPCGDSQDKQNLQLNNTIKKNENPGMFYRIGFNISKTRFIETMRICYNEIQLRTLYVKYSLSAANSYNQRGLKRLTFSQGDYFKNFNFNYLYTFTHQTSIIQDLFENKMQMLYNEKKQKFQCYLELNSLFNHERNLFLARGHLAAKVDFIYANQQRSTFNFFNVAPQWQTFNDGSWSQLENEIKNYLNESKLTVDCYVGSIDVLQLNVHNEQNCVNQKLPLYLTTDNNNNNILPVPFVFFKILVDSKRPKFGIAFLGINNPYYESAIDFIEIYTYLCKDIHHHIKWLNWIQNNDTTLGYLYACRVSDLLRNVTFLPFDLKNVTEILDI